MSRPWSREDRLEVYGITEADQVEIERRGFIERNTIDGVKVFRVTEKGAERVRALFRMRGLNADEEYLRSPTPVHYVERLMSKPVLN